MIFVNENAHYIENKQCSWTCHNNTLQCKQNHTKLLKPFLHIIDVPYNKIIEGLSGTGNYKLANVAFLVILWPFLMLFLFIKILSFLKQIKTLQNG